MSKNEFELNFCPECFGTNIQDGVCIECGCGSGKSQGHKNNKTVGAGTELSERYTVGKVLRYSEFSTLYYAFDRQKNKRVAIECVINKYTRLPYYADAVKAPEEMVARVRSYIESVAKLEISGLLTYTDCFEQDGSFYYVHDFYNGTNLYDYIKQRGILKTGEAVRMLRKIAEPICAMNEIGMVNGSIDASRVFIDENGNAQVKCSEYFSLIFAQNEERETMVTSGFVPSEYYSGYGLLTCAADVYSVAALAYFLITGREIPLCRDREYGEDITDPAQFGANITDEAAAILFKALEIYPEERTADVNEFLNAFEQANTTVIEIENDLNDESAQQQTTVQPISVQESEESVGIIEPPMAQAQANADVNAQANVDVNAQTDVDVNAQADVDVNAQTDVDVNAQTDVDVNAQTDVDVNAQADAEFNAQTKVETKSETKPKAKSEAKVENTEENKPEDAEDIFAKKKKYMGIRIGIKIAVIAVLVFALAAVIVMYALNPTALFSKRKASVPSITGLSVNQAKTLLEKSGFHILITNSENSLEDAGCVNHQLPNANEKAIKGDIVKVTLSVGNTPKKEGVVPNARYMRIDYAMRVFEDCGYMVSIELAPSDDIAAGCIIEQSELAGTQIDTKTVINLTVSSGSLMQLERIKASATVDTAQAAVIFMDGEKVYDVRVSEAGKALGELIPTPPEAIDHNNLEFIGWSREPEGKGGEFAADSELTGTAIFVYAFFASDGTYIEDPIETPDVSIEPVEPTPTPPDISTSGLVGSPGIADSLPPATILTPDPTPVSPKPTVTSTATPKPTVTATPTATPKPTPKASDTPNPTPTKTPKPTPEFYLDDIYFENDEITLMLGETMKLRVKYNGNPDNKNLKYRSGNARIAAIDSAGRVAANSIGETYVYAVLEFDGGIYEAMCHVIVIPHTEDSIGGGTVDYKSLEALPLEK